MSISEIDITELKQLYLKRYGVTLSDTGADELARRLLMLFGIIGKKIPEGKIPEKKT